MKHEPTQDQKNVYDCTLATLDDIAVDATAGSGKTTTIVEAVGMIPYGKRAIFVAFNKSIVTTLKDRLPPGVECNTMHSVGCRAIFSYFQDYSGQKLNKVDDDKCRNLIVPYCDKEGRKPKEKWALAYSCVEIMSKARATMCERNKEAMMKMCDDYVLDATEEQITIVLKALARLDEYNSDRDRNHIVIDFQDMIEIPVKYKWIRMSQYDYVFVDEIQDLSELDHLFIDRLVKPITGRRIGVGDPNQSIYGFRGSNPRSFDHFVNKRKTIRLPLSTSFRCSKAVVKEAQKIYPVIQPYSEAKEGRVWKAKHIDDVREGDFVLCRNNRPLIDVFFQLVAKGIKAYVKGRDIERGLLNLLARIDSSAECEEVRQRLDDILIEKERELQAKGIKKVSLHPRYCALDDKVSVLKLLFTKFKYVHEVEMFIGDVFDNDDREGVCLMTIHKAKGLENDRVFIIERYDNIKLIPSKWATTKDQLTQEKNLQFVAVTRSKDELCYLSL